MYVEDRPIEFCPRCQETYHPAQPDPTHRRCGWDPRTGTEHNEEDDE